MKFNISEAGIINHRKQICSRLRQRREELEISPEALAEKIGITPAAVLKIENGEWDFKLSFLTAFLEALGLEIKM